MVGMVCIWTYGPHQEVRELCGILALAACTSPKHTFSGKREFPLCIIICGSCRAVRWLALGASAVGWFVAAGRSCQVSN